MSFTRNKAVQLATHQAETIRVSITRHWWMVWCKLDPMGRFRTILKTLGSRSTPALLEEICPSKIKIIWTKVWWFNHAAIRHKIWYLASQLNLIFRGHQLHMVDPILERPEGRDPLEPITQRTNSMQFMEEEWAFKIMVEVLSTTLASPPAQKESSQRFSRTSITGRQCKTTNIKTTLITWTKLMAKCNSTQEMEVVHQTLSNNWSRQITIWESTYTLKEERGLRIRAWKLAQWEVSEITKEEVA